MSAAPAGVPAMPTAPTAPAVPLVPPARDAGVTLVEMLTAMAVFAVVITVFLGGLVSMTRTTARTQDVVDAGDAVRKAFSTMDHQIRYASSINFPGPGAGGTGYYVEFVRPAPDNGGAPICTQWRYDAVGRLLQTRSWPNVTAAVPTAWATVVTDMRNPLDSRVPFSLTPAGVSGSARQQLTVRVDVGDGPAGPTAERGADTTTVFVARNSSTASPSNADANADGASDAPVCSIPGGRP